MNIEQDALIIPRGAYILQPNGDVERNRTFEGQINNRLFIFQHDLIEIFQD